MVTDNESTLVVNPFVSQAQRAACYAKADPNWDCKEWEAATPKGRKLPKRKATHNVRPSKVDPSRTFRLRQRFAAAMKRRFDGLKKAIVDLVSKENAFGLMVKNYDPSEARDENGRWVAGEAGEKVWYEYQKSYRSWADKQESDLEALARKHDWRTAKDQRTGSRYVSFYKKSPDDPKDYDEFEVRISDHEGTHGGYDWDLRYGAGNSQDYQEIEKRLKNFTANAFGLMVKNAFCSTGPGGGQDNSCSPSGGNKQTETPAFKSWFGDSKVVNADGKPLVVYHGSGRDFSTFDPNMIGQGDPGFHGEGFYFSEDSEYASAYAPTALYGGNVKPVYLKIEKPFEAPSRFTHGEEKWREVYRAKLADAGVAAGASRSEQTTALLAAGYDGVILRGKGGILREIVAFHPTQIKSAIGNKGTFDPKDPDIRNVATMNSYATRYLPLPDIRQRDHWSCGAAACASVGGYFGVGPEELDEWKLALGTTLEKSTHPYAISGYLSTLGLDVETKHGMTIEDLAKEIDAGHPVIVCYQDYTHRDPKSTDKAGHYTVVVQVTDSHVIVQDPAYENTKRRPGGSVPEDEEDHDGSVEDSGKKMIPRDEFLKVWHDEDAEGNKFIRFGIVVSGVPVVNAFCPTGQGGGVDPYAFRSTANYNPNEARDESTTNTRFAFQTTPDQVEAFRRWLAQQVRFHILGTMTEEVERGWWEQYVREGYLKGQGRAWDDVHPYVPSPEGISTEGWYAGSRQDFLRSAFGRPVSVEKVKLLAGRVYTDLKGVTEAMSTKIQRDLTDGLVQGQNPRRIAKTLADDVEQIGLRRADLIARTELIRAHGAGFLQSMREMGLDEVGVAAEWMTTPDSRLCDLCAALEGIVMSIDEAEGLIPRHPNCLPGDCLVTSRSQITATSKRLYDGNLIVIRTASGRELSCTPNHPILTDLGWVPANTIHVGSNVVCDGGSEWEPAFHYNESQYVPTSIEQVARAFAEASEVCSIEVPLTAPDFHGDGMDGDVAVVRAYGKLGSTLQSALLEHFEESDLVVRDVSVDDLSGPGQETFCMECPRAAAHCIVSSLGLLAPGVFSHARPFDSFGLALVASQYPSLKQNPSNDVARNSTPFGEAIFGFSCNIAGYHIDVGWDRLSADGLVLDTKGKNDPSRRDLVLAADILQGAAGPVFLDNVVLVGVRRYSGHVYNLQTEGNYYTAEGIIAHNCRCTYTASNVGEPKKGQIRPRGKIMQALDESIAAESGKGSLSLKREKSTWTGADLEVSKRRPEGVLNYDPNQARDQWGEWSSGAESSGPKMLPKGTKLPSGFIVGQAVTASHGSMVYKGFVAAFGGTGESPESGQSPKVLVVDQQGDTLGNFYADAVSPRGRKTRNVSLNGDLGQKLHAILNAFCPTGEGGGQDNSCSPQDSSVVKAGPNDRKLLAAWATDRLYYAINAFDSDSRKGTTVLVIKSAGELKGVASCRVVKDIPGHVYVPWFVTKESGYGRKLLSGVCTLASKKGRGVALISTGPAKGFYDKMGMGTEVFRGAGWRMELRTLTPKQAARFASSGVTNAFCPTGQGGGVDPTCRLEKSKEKDRMRKAAAKASRARMKAKSQEKPAEESEAAKRLGYKGKDAELFLEGRGGDWKAGGLYTATDEEQVEALKSSFDERLAKEKGNKLLVPIGSKSPADVVKKKIRHNEEIIGTWTGNPSPYGRGIVERYTEENAMAHRMLSILRKGSK